MKNKKIAVAMSGGVDSSVAAALLAEQYGKENVFGVTMRLFCYAEKSDNPKNCCSLESINDAKAVCNKIGIKHYVIDFEKEFKSEVIRNFISEYQKGHTPNPCIRCNSIIKSKYLLDKAKELGASKMATGHYARISEVENDKGASGNNYRLFKGIDSKKDQSYFLYGLSKEQLGHTLFPLGDITKEQARKIAKKFELKTAGKTESQDICFIEGNDYKSFLKENLIRVDEGEIVNTDGLTLGRHTGLAFYTIGQRKGLGIAAENPLYVTNLDETKNQVVVGSEQELLKSELKVRDLNLLTDKKEFRADVSVRYNMEPQKADVKIIENEASVIFDQPQRAITPGQSAVFYDGEEVLGGGIII